MSDESMDPYDAKMSSMENSEIFHLLQVLTEHLCKTITTEKITSPSCRRQRQRLQE